MKTTTKATTLIAALAGLCTLGESPLPFVSTAAAQEATASSTGSPTLDALDPAVRNYLLASAVKTFEAMSQLNLGEMNPVAALKLTLRVNEEVPADQLPSTYQEYLKARLAMANEILQKIEGSQATSPESIMEIFAQYATKESELEQKYPEAAKVLGMDAQTEIGNAITEELALMPKAMEHIHAHMAELDSQEKVASELMKFLAEELKKYIR